MKKQKDKLTLRDRAQYKAFKLIYKTSLNTYNDPFKAFVIAIVATADNVYDALSLTKKKQVLRLTKKMK